MPTAPDYSKQPWWPRRIPLNQILGRIGTAEARQRYEELKAASSASNLIQRVSASGELSSGIEPISALRAAEDEQKSLVLTALHQGALLAYGYQLPRRIDDPPVAIPISLWRHAVRWHKNEIEGVGIKLVEVCLIPLKTIQALNNEAPTPQAHGRPTRETEIMQAHDFLITSGAIKASDTIKTKGPVIRAHLKSQNPSPDSRTDGLSDETIRRILKNHPQNTEV